MNTFARSFFDPFGMWTRPSRPVMSEGPDRSGQPIDIKASASDAGIKIKAGADSVTIRGTAKGAEEGRDIFGQSLGYTYARGVSFSLDVDHAPTTDIFGNTNYTEKNSRLFNVMTSAGASAEQVANALAKKVNKEDDFKATVTVNADGSARIDFERR